MAHEADLVNPKSICRPYAEQHQVYNDQPSFKPEDLNQQYSFPYPKNGSTTRPPGQGCKACVHQTYCPALYHFRREVQREPDDNNGRACESFSADVNDQNRTINDFDSEQNAYKACFGISEEANRSGLS